MLQTIIIALFVMNALFWGLYPHSFHCKIISMLGVKKCPSHWLHLSMGLVSFLVAIGLAQKDFLFRID